jgi:hydroxymethylpyrimidine pyrophosphatase-like HAD family hydrolase
MRHALGCDLDGTIVRLDGSISDRTLAALAACEERGIDVLFVTGRPPRWMPGVAEVTGHHGVAICGNGAVVYDLGGERVVATRGLTEEAVLAVGRALREALPTASLALETTSGYRREPGFLPHHAGGPSGGPPRAVGRSPSGAESAVSGGGDPG